MSLRLLQQLCSVPTAPFAEGRVVEFVERFVDRRPNLRLERDRDGNLLIELRGRSQSRRQPRWVFAAHMDHPGLVARKMLDAHTLEADFRGWVLSEFLKGQRVRFFDEDRQIPGVITELCKDRSGAVPPTPDRVLVRVAGPVSRNSPGMFDQGEGRFRNGKFYCRACDDLAGAASALAMLDALSRNPAAAGVPVAVLLTRAEEEAFIGAIAAVLRPRLLRKTDRIIAIECSAEQPYARQGNGTIVRVGDQTSIFHSSLTYFLTQQCQELAKVDRNFKFQRALMPGGTCEATVYDIWGYTAASVCVPLGNYHNMDRRRGKLGPEYIDVADWKNMVKLFLRLAAHGGDFAAGHGPLKRRITTRFNRLKRFLADGV